MVVFYGRHLGPESHYGDQNAGQMRGCVYDAASQTLWVYGLGGWVGDPDGGTAPTGRYAVYETDAAKNPTTRVGYSNSFTASTAYTSASGGANQEATIAVADNGPTNGACILYAGRRYALAFLPTGSDARHSMKPAANITADNEQFYNRSGLSQPPPAPFGSYSASVEGHMSLWALADVNVAPDTPSTGLAPSGTVNETAPTFTANFRDQNAGHSGGTDRGDWLNQYRIQVRRVSDGTIFWNSTYTALAAEQAADAVSRAYGGTTLVRGTAYEWRVQMSDFVNAWSSWSAWTSFTPANLGFVTLDSDPTGKILDDTPDFKGRWNHQSAASMTRVQVRILSSGGTVLQTGADYDIADVASSAPPGTLFTVPWANTGLTALSWGTAYKYQIRGKDATLWSDWSAARTFNTDAYPTTPSGLAPSGSLVVTSLPKLAFTLTDSDDTPDGIGGNLHGYIRAAQFWSISNPDLNANATGWVEQQADANQTYNIGRQTDQAHEGAGSYRIQVTASTAVLGSGIFVRNDTFVPVTPGQPTRAHGWFRRSTTDVTIRLGARWFDATFVELSTSSTAMSPAVNTWEELERIATPPANAFWAKFFWGGDTTVTNGLYSIWGDEMGLDGYREASWNATSSRFEYQTTGLDLPFKPTTVSWYAWGNDETLQGNNSATATFTYADGPTVTITAPTEAQVLTSSSVTVSWTVDTGGPQAKYRVRLYDDSGSTPLYDSGLLTSTATTHVIPSGYVRNDTQYDVKVTVENDVALQGTSTIRNFSVDYVEPDPVANVQVAAIAYATDPWETAIRISWDQTEYATPEWQEYTIARRAASGPDQAEIVLARITSPSQTAYVDNAPASGIEYTYALKQVTVQGLDTLDSPTVEGSATVTIAGVVLTHVSQGGTYRAILRSVERSHDRQMQEAVYHPVSGNGPLTIRNKTYYWQPDIVALLISDDVASAAERRQALEALDALYPAPTIVYRDGAGRKQFMKITSLRIDDELPDWFTARVGLRSEFYVEGSE